MTFDSQSLPSSFAELRLSDYHYDLPAHRIAAYPLEQRDQSKLLLYQSGQIQHRRFFDLHELLPSNTLLVFNNTKVVKARLYFRRATGALIEVLLLSPMQPHDIQLALQTEEGVQWHCVIGNKKRWKEEEVLKLPLKVGEKKCVLQAQWVNKVDNEVQFEWDGGFTFSQILEAIGKLPLPPYLNREAEERDLQQYQTVYAKAEGAVAAPTAGLHFTDQVLEQLTVQGIPSVEVTLHVGAGTFLPVKDEQVSRHRMHEEQLVLEVEKLRALRDSQRAFIPVGTTALRFLESVFALGVKVWKGEVNSCEEPFSVESYEPYFFPENLPSRQEIMTTLIELMEREGVSRWVGETRIYVLPGYTFRMCRGLITNFHMPETTLMLLVAALIGEDWRRVYQEALDQGYRFLSYGDSSLLIP